MSKRASGWKKLCKMAAVDDGLPVRESGLWAAQKLFFWNRYIEITTKAMVGSPKWPNGVCYVDLFAGPGICQIKESKERLPGSPLIAAYAPKPFTLMILCELKDDMAIACESRLNSSPASKRYHLLCGNCNDRIVEVLSLLPTGALTLAFIDPTGLHVHMDSLATLSSHGPVDLLILFPDAMDIIRNAEFHYFEHSRSKLDLVLGSGADWRTRLADLPSDDASMRRRLFTEIYKDQLRSLAEYVYFADEVIQGPAGPLYRLIYATKHSRGLDFWNKSVSKELGGQQRLF